MTNNNIKSSFIASIHHRLMRNNVIITTSMGILYIGKYKFYGMWVVSLFWQINIRFSVILFDESLVFMLFSLFRFIWWYIVLLAMILLFHLCVNTCDVVNQFLLLISEAIDVSHALMSDSESLFHNAWCALWWQLFLNVIVLPLIFMLVYL